MGSQLNRPSLQDPAPYTIRMIFWLLKGLFLLALLVWTPALVHAKSVRDYCVGLPGNQQMVRLVFPLVRIRYSKIEFRQELVKEMTVRGYQECKASHVRPFVIENEFPVGEGMSVEGDICGPSPKFIIYSVRQLRDLYPGYSVNGRVSPDPMVRYISIALAATMKRCGGAKPEQMRFAARIVDRLPDDVHFAAIKGKIKKAPFVKNDFFSGTVFLKQGLRIVNDDPEQEAAFLKEQGARLDAAQRGAEEKARRQAVGALLGPLLLGAASDFCNPTDPSCR